MVCGVWPLAGPRSGVNQLQEQPLDSAEGSERGSGLPVLQRGGVSPPPATCLFVLGISRMLGPRLPSERWGYQSCRERWPFQLLETHWGSAGPQSRLLCLSALNASVPETTSMDCSTQMPPGVPWGHTQHRGEQAPDSCPGMELGPFHSRVLSPEPGRSQLGDTAQGPQGSCALRAHSVFPRTRSLN